MQRPPNLKSEFLKALVYDEGAPDEAISSGLAKNALTREDIR